MGKLGIQNLRPWVVWCVWGGLLVCLPYGADNVVAPMLPLHMTLAAPCLGIAALVAFDLLGAIGSPAWRGGTVCRMFTVLSVVSGATYILIELYALFFRTGIIDSAPSSLSSWIGFAEALSASVSWICWGVTYRLRIVSTKSAGIDAMAYGGIPFAAGALASLLASAPLFTRLNSFSGCLIVSAVFFVVGVLALFAWVRRGYLSGSDPTLLLAGCVFGSIVGDFARGQNAYFGLYVGEPNAAWYVVGVGLIIFVAVLPLLASRQRAKGINSSYEPRLADDATYALTSRESEILARTVLGQTGSRIADEMGISEGTVSTYRSRGYRKLGISGKAELMSRAADGKISVISEDISIASSAVGRAVAVGRGTIFCMVLIATMLYFVAVAFAFLGGEAGRLAYSAWDPARIWLTIALLIGAGSIGTALTGGLYRQPGDVSHLERPLREAAFAVSALTAFALSRSWSFDVWQVVLSVLVICAAIAFAFKLVAPHDGKAALQKVAAGTADLGLHALFPLVGSSLLLAGSMLGMWSIMGAVEPLGAVANVLWALLVAVTCHAALVSHDIDRARVEDAADFDRRCCDVLRAHGMGELQVQVMLDSMHGRTVRDICRHLSTTENTVKTYRSRGCKMLGVRRVSELRVALAREVDAAAGQVPRSR